MRKSWFFQGLIISSTGLFLACGGSNAPVDASPTGAPVASDITQTSSTGSGFSPDAGSKNPDGDSGSVVDQNKSDVGMLDFRGQFIIGQTELRWNALELENLSAFNIRRAETAITDFRVGELIYRGRDIQFIDSAPPLADDVHYRLFLEFSNGEVTASDTFSIRTLTTINDEPPLDVSDIEFINNGDSLTLGWTNPLDEDLKRISIYRGIENSANVQASPYRVFDALTTSFTDTNITADTTYFYYFIAEDSLANSSAGIEQSFLFEDTQPPLPASIFTSSPSEDSVFLSWLPSNSDDVTHYAILRNGARHLNYAESLPENTLTTSSLSISDLNLATDTEYKYVLYAVDASGNASTGIELTTQTQIINRPDAPKNFRQLTHASDEDGRIYFSWSLTNPELNDSPVADQLILAWNSEGYLNTLNSVDENQQRSLAADVTEIDIALNSTQGHYFSLFAVSEQNGETIASFPATLFGYASDNTPPPIATEFLATATNSGIQLAWQTAAEAEPYDVVIRWSNTAPPENLTDGKLLVRQPAQLNSVLHTTAAAGNTYHYSIFTVDKNDNVITENILTQQAVAPAQVTIDALVNLQATPGDGEISFSWNALIQNTTRVYIQNSIDPNVELDSDLMNEFFIDNEQNFVHKNLANGLRQNYWIYTEDTATEVRSEVIELALTPADNLPPLQVQNVSAIAFKNSITLNWNEDNLTDARQVIISMSTSAAPENSSVGKAVYNHEPGRATAFSVENLLEDTRYYFSFFTLDSQNNESHPISLYATTKDTEPPLKPLGLEAYPRDNEILLRWQRPTDTDVIGVEITRNLVPDLTIEDDAIFEINSSATYFSDKTALNDQAYAYGVRFIDRSGLKSEPSLVAAMALDTTPPDKIYNLNANGTDNQVDLQWQNPILSDATRLVIRYQTGDIPPPTPELENNFIELIPPLPNTYSISELVNDQLYAFSVFALDSTGNFNSFESVTAQPRSTAPSPPATEFKATGEDSLVRLEWVNPPSNYTGINIYRSNLSFNDALTNGELLTGAALPPGQTNYTDAGLPNGITYFYVLINTGENDDSIAVQASAIPVDQTEPFPITGLIASPSDQQIVFTWTDPSDSDLSHVLIRRGELDFPLSTLDGQKVAEVARGTQTITDSGLENDDIYFYAFFAIDVNGYASQRVTLAVAARDTIAPAPVTSANISQGNAQVRLSWQNPTDSDLSRIVIRRAADVFPASATSGFSVASLDNGTGNIAESFTDSGLSNDETYYYSLFALDANNNASAAVNLTGLPADVEAPPPITGLSVNELDGEVQFSWTNPSNADFDRVVLLRRQAVYPASYNDGAATAIYEGNGIGVTDNISISNGTLYKYRFFILDEYNNAATVDVEAGPQDLTAPQLPVCTACIYGDESVSLTWTDPAAADLLRIHVRRSTLSPPANLDEGTPFIPVNAGVQTFTDTGLTNGTTYFYALFSEDLNGNISAAYAIAPLTPQDDIPTAPVAGTSVVNAEGSVTLNWSNPADADFEKVVIRRDDLAYPANNSEGTLIAELSNDEVTYTDFGVTDGEDYFYSIFAFDEPAANNASSPVNLLGQPRDITAPPPVTGQSANGLDARIDLTWVNPVHPDFDRVLILRKTVSFPTDIADGSATVIYDGNAQSVSDIDSLTNFTNYYYRFFALDEFDNFVSSDLIANPIDLTPPALVACTSCTGGDEQAILTWANPADPDLAAVRIRRSTAGYPTDINTGDVIADLVLGEVTFTDTGLNNAEDYYYSIFSEDTSANVSAAYQVPLISPADDTLPAAVSGLTTTSINQRITLFWTNPGDDTVKVYIRRDTSNYPADKDSGTDVATVNISGANDLFDDTGVSINTPYYYSLFSEDEAGNLSGAANLLVTPLDQTAPANATSFIASKGDYEIDLTWVNPVDADFNSVNIYRSTGSTLPTATATYLITTLNSGETSLTDTGRAAYTQYSYRITSVDNLGNESSGVTSSAYTDYATIADATLLLTMEKDSKTFLQWQPSTHVHFNQVELRRSTGAAPTNLSEGDFVYRGTATQFEDSGLTNATPYNYTLFSIEDDSDVTAGTQVSLTPLASGSLEYEGPLNFDDNGAGQVSALEHFNLGGTPQVRLVVGAKNNATVSYSSLTAVDYNGVQNSTRHYAWGTTAQKVNDIAYNSYWFAAGSKFDTVNSNDDFAQWKIYNSLSSIYSSMNFDTGSASFNDEASNTIIAAGLYYSSGYRDISGTLRPVVWLTNYYTQLQIGFSSGAWTIPTAASEGKVIDHIYTSTGRHLFAIESSTGSDSVVLASLSSSTGTLDTSFDGDGERLIPDDEVTSLSRSSSGETNVSFPIYVSSVATGDAKIYALQADGSLLASFATAGIATLSHASGDVRIEDMVKESDGTLHVIGSLDDSTNLDIMYWRLATDGTVEVTTRLVDDTLGSVTFDQQWPERILLDQFTEQVIFTGTGFDGGSGYEILFGRISND